MTRRGYQALIDAPDEDRLNIFLETAMRLGTPVQYIEKDFWVCWTLNELYNGLQGARPRLLFKGGTALSKAHALISRFSEDIDITVFRSDLVSAKPGTYALVPTSTMLEALRGDYERMSALRCSPTLRNRCRLGDALGGPPKRSGHLAMSIMQTVAFVTI